MGWTMNLARFKRRVMERSAVRNIRTQEDRRSGRKMEQQACPMIRTMTYPLSWLSMPILTTKNTPKLHERSITDPERFCTEQAERLVTRFEPWEKVAW